MQDPRLCLQLKPLIDIRHLHDSTYHQRNCYAHTDIFGMKDSEEELSVPISSDGSFMRKVLTIINTVLENVLLLPDEQLQPAFYIGQK